MIHLRGDWRFTGKLGTWPTACGLLHVLSTGALVAVNCRRCRATRKYRVGAGIVKPLRGAGARHAGRVRSRAKE